MAVNRDAVARRAKVSTAVVSYVINDGPKPVAAKTRERVLAAIEELGYRPDRAARQLARGGRSHTLGFIRANFESWYMNEVTELLSAAAERRGYHLFVTSSDNDLERERAQLIDMAERRVDGVILMPVDPSAEHLSFAQSLDLPVLVIDRPAIASRRTVAATQHMIEHRHERIAIVTGLRARVNSERRRDAW
ncbi:LacI family DNA-binding transcriptional regulator, partial [Pseudactinotalea sp.]|uniref:LacI family DNA-binding transcriptional regulator n=1 Tax=Pseudactinotalea sp. TaxID=1926260 RepID=UPI003B3B5D6D